jgi:hypothetical protein
MNSLKINWIKNMILSKYVEVILGTFTIKYYENKGYFIPKIINSDNKIVVKRGTKIIVRVSDLPKESTTKILRKCDKCGKEGWFPYRSYRDSCIECCTAGENNPMYNSSRYGSSNPAWKNGLPKCADCGKPLKNYNNIRCRSCWGKFEAGENHPNWNPNLTDRERYLSKNRSSQCWGIGKWKKSVKEKDKFTCQCCGSNRNLIVHHKESYKDFKDLRLDINNGITLCVECHKKFHHKYGTKHNRTYQIIDFLNQKHEKESCVVDDFIKPTL